MTQVVCEGVLKSHCKPDGKGGGYGGGGAGARGRGEERSEASLTTCSPQGTIVKFCGLSLKMDGTAQDSSAPVTRAWCVMREISLDQTGRWMGRAR